MAVCESLIMNEPIPTPVNGCWRITSIACCVSHKRPTVEITSVEVSGQVKSIKLALKTNNGNIIVEMDKNEFFNFLSLILAFKDVIIGEELDFAKDQSVKRYSRIDYGSADRF